ncbi:unnamed protein product [Thlaspi arvense]|uniref:Uncharacterized protein n=1 Tax=Thlaspi arvense TaxID=13288 RepID=A0AAU9RT23_THLAR|nr:unnamed protein product [Thlaspi arvense]
MMIPLRKSRRVEDTQVGAGTVAAMQEAMAASAAVVTPMRQLTVWGCRNTAAAKSQRNCLWKRKLLGFGLRADPEKGS